MLTTLERLRQRREEMRGEGGFTLIELLIVIVILGILAAIVVFAVSSLSGTSAKAACGSDYKTVQTAAEAYKAQVGQYPGTAGTPGADAGGTNPGIQALMGTQTVDGTTVGPWLKTAPVNGNHYSMGVEPTADGSDVVISVYPSSNLTGTAGTTQAFCTTGIS
jgi:prepilin-type N-terminal cleavage/methylation domain-containing protein